MTVFPDDALDAFEGGGRAGTRTSLASRRPLLPQTSRRYSFYSPELNLIAESELTTSTAPAVLHEYIWFNGRPVAQVDAGTTVSWTFTDHLGTPIVQTSSVQGVVWQAEYEPYGKVYALRAGDGQHQPLRLPGQEAEQLELGANGLTERSYNIYRWYRAGWGRYTQADPIGFVGGVDPFVYSFGNPADWFDGLGLAPQRCCDPVRDETEIRNRIARMRELLNELDIHGVLPITQDTAAKAMTLCATQRAFGPTGPIIGVIYTSTETISGAKDSPCIIGCGRQHEQLHRRQCANFGPRFYLLTDVEAEKPAYMNELGCLLQLLADAGLRHAE